MSFLVLKILSSMDEVVSEFEVSECLDAVLSALIEEVAREELLLRPPVLEISVELYTG